MRLKFPKDFNISPMSFILSEDYEAFYADRERDMHNSQYYILKPVAASCGRGIKICDSKQRISKKEGILASKYIENPHLLNGLKYDLRVYVLVTQFNPLKIYIYNDGLVRFATEKYSMDPKQMNQKFVHLTNFSINKRNTKFVKNNDAKNDSSDGEEETQESSKWDFKQLQQAYARVGANYNQMFGQMKDIIIKTLLAVEPTI